MKKALIIFFMLCVSSCADNPIRETDAAAPKSNAIIGAFGLKLGDRFDDKISLLKDKVPWGWAHKIRPPQRVRGYTYYSVSVTPITNRIVGIYAAQDFEIKHQCLNKLNVSKERLSRKYGQFKKVAAASNEKYVAWIDNRAISVECEQLKGMASFSIFYMDNELVQLGSKEQAQSL